MTQPEKLDLPKFTIRQLIEAGVHFGHKTMRRNPKMSRYIHTNRNGISIIDLNKTANLLHNSLKVVKQIAKNNGRILFIATKKQAAEAVSEAATRSGQYFVNSRWLGGMLTNWKTVSQSLKTLKKIEDQLVDEEIGFNKKEKLMLERQKTKLDLNLGGIRNMGGYPDLVIVIDTNKEALAIAEAKKLKIPIMAILDTNCDPEGIAFPIPGNDDSAKSIKLYCHLISDAIIEGIKENMSASGLDIRKIKDEDFSEKLQEMNSENKNQNKKDDGTNRRHSNKKYEGGAKKEKSEVGEKKEASVSRKDKKSNISDNSTPSIKTAVTKKSES